jgi:hypothetical protein
VDHEEAVYHRLQGTFKHYCHDFDGLAIDETCYEFRCCTCTWRDLMPEEATRLEQLRAGFQDETENEPSESAPTHRAGAAGPGGSGTL